MKKFVKVFSDKQELIDGALAILIDQIDSAIQQRDCCTIALSGGSTPKPLYEALSRQSLPWEKLQVFWGDERYVSPDHPDSNQKMAREAWLDRVEIPAANIHAMPTDAGDPKIDADKYRTRLSDFFRVPPSQMPIFDIILLGIGDDGHTASLFPHTEALQVRDRSIAVGNKDGQPRLTFTIPLINRARYVVFLVAGASKKPALAQIFAESADEMTYPARSIRPEGELWWVLDRAAGEELEQKS